jgi:hypothetical protein
VTARAYYETDSMKWHPAALAVLFWGLTPAPVALGAQSRAGLCPVTEPVRADAPPDPSADPMLSSYWHISPDQLLWAPSAPPGASPTSIGRYWVRPKGTRLKFVVRRLDVPGDEIVSTERSGYPSGFYFGSIDVPTDGCWQVTATNGTSQVTFVAEIRYPIERFARQAGTRLVWSKEIGRIEDGESRLVATVLQLEDQASVTRGARGIRIDVTNGVISDQLWLEIARLSGIYPGLEGWAAGRLPMLQSVGSGHYAKGDESGLSLIGREHQYSFPGRHRPSELARLMLQALEELRAQDR